jgi:pullulanase/glycogen debranching enzyme
LFPAITLVVLSSVLVFCQPVWDTVKINYARIQSSTTVEVSVGKAPEKLNASDFSIDNGIAVKKFEIKNDVVKLTTSAFDLTKDYTITVEGIGKKELQPDGVFDSFSSSKPLGCNVESGKTVFRVFAPRAAWVKLVMFNRHDDERGKEYTMVKDQDGVWEFKLPGAYYRRYYSYQIAGPDSPTEMFDSSAFIADPYSKAVATKNHYLHPGKTLIIKTSNYDWEGDKFANLDIEDAIIYEMHVRDMTVHPSSGVTPEKRGTYMGLIAKGKKGGFSYIKQLGSNAIQLLPSQDFGNYELPFRDSSISVYNTWNPYSRNHWGYMTSYFFAPESYYATGGTMEPGKWNGMDGRQVREFKDMVKAFHKEGIAVLMDVVYNHVSQYDQNCFKHIDKKYYFRLDNDQGFESKTACGNDFKTERPMARRLILESVKYWMKEYHIDGFRFDMAAMIDWQTCEEIMREAKKINPKAIIIAEAWGGGKYDLAGFSRIGWGAWNDWIRNGVKGQNPNNALGFIFGKWYESNDIESMKRYVRGTVVADGGPFVKASQSINYLESHDDQTLGDFIRIGNRDVDEHEKITDIDKNAELTERQMKLNKLAALFLFTSQGAVMMHEGQEYARSKVIAYTSAPDPNMGEIDHNSYEKDNETNWLNFNQKDMNMELVNYYRGLIALRKAHPAFRRSNRNDVRFVDCETPFAFGYVLQKNSSHDRNDFMVLMNGNPEQPAVFMLPEGKWHVVVDGRNVGTKRLRITTGRVTVSPTSGIVLSR